MKILEPDKNTGDLDTAAMYNEVKNVVNTNDDAAVEDFNPSIKADRVRYFRDYTQSGVINLVKDANVLPESGGVVVESGYHGIIISDGSAINHSNDFNFITKDVITSGEKYALTAIWTGLSFSASLLKVEQPKDTTGPAFISAIMKADNATIDLTFDTGIYGASDGSTPNSLNDFDYIFFANGGTATSWTASSISQVGGQPLTGGETIVEVHGTLVGTASGVEYVQIKPAGQTTVFDVNGNAMSFSESVNAIINVLSIIVMQDDFVGTTIDPLKWTVIDPVDGVTISQNDQLIFSLDKDNEVPSSIDNNVQSIDTVTSGSFQFDALGDSITSTLVYGFGVDSNNQAQIITYGSVNEMVVIRVWFNGADDYSLVTNIPFKGNTFKIEINTNNDINFYYLSAPNTWTPMGVTHNVDLGANKELWISASSIGSTGIATFITDNVYLTNANYSTSVPV